MDASRQQCAGAKLEGSIGLLLPEKPNNIIPNCSPGSYSSWQVPEFFSSFLLPRVEQSCSCRYIDYGRMKLPN